MLDFIRNEYLKTRAVLDAIIADQGFSQTLLHAAEISTKALKDGKKIMFCGNGGSAADSQHLAAELINRLNYARPGLNAVALTVDTSVLTSIGNDYGYEKSFSRQIEAIGQSGDVLFAFSTSGRSGNIIEAVNAARKKGIITIGFLGQDGQDVGALVDVRINIPSSETPKIQEGHIIAGHIICGIVEENIFGATYNPKRTNA